MSIDIVRGSIMLLMALDHARYYLSNRVYQPEDIAHTDLPLFLTRLVTHFCAPGFFLIAGIAVWLAAVDRPPAAMRRFLAARGLWMITLELTLIGFAWSFVPGSSFAGVIWTFGWTFLGLAAVSRLGPLPVGTAGIVYLVFHDALDFAGLVRTEPFGFIWAILEVPGETAVPLVGDWFVLFPVLPWMAVSFAGFGLGPLFRRPPDERQRWLIVAGTLCIALFLLLRLTNSYGNPDTLWITGGPGRFEFRDTVAPTLIMLLNTEKYPPSLQFLLMTLGPTLVALGWLVRLDTAARLRVPFGRFLAAIGRVPMFFYIVHLYVIHLTALGLSALTGQNTDWLGWMGGGTNPRDGSGFGLLAVYVAWMMVSAVLYVACAYFADVKRRRNRWWLRYL